MDTLRAIFMILGALLAVGGSVAVVALEFGSSAERRLVSRLRDTIEVLLPPVAVVVLVWLVWLGRV
jgi:hypothetical protein